MRRAGRRGTARTARRERRAARARSPHAARRRQRAGAAGRSTTSAVEARIAIEARRAEARARTASCRAGPPASGGYSGPIVGAAVQPLSPSHQSAPRTVPARRPWHRACGERHERLGPARGAAVGYETDVEAGAVEQARGDRRARAGPAEDRDRAPRAASSREAGRQVGDEDLRSAPGTTPSCCHSIGWRTSSRTPRPPRRRALGVQRAASSSSDSSTGHGRTRPTRSTPPASQPGHPLVADAQQLGGGLGERVRRPVGQHEQHRRAERHEPADVARERPVELDVERARQVARRERRAIARIDDRRRLRAATPRLSNAAGSSAGGRISRPRTRGPRRLIAGHVRVVRGARGRGRRGPARGTRPAPRRRARTSGSRTAPRRSSTTRLAPAGPALQKLPAPWVGRISTASGQLREAAQASAAGRRSARR